MGIIPWPDNLLQLPVPGSSLLLLDAGDEENGQRRRDVGRGGYGIVYAALNTDNPRKQRAVKFPLWKEGEGSESDLDAFRKEASLGIEIGNSHFLARTFALHDLRAHPPWPPFAIEMEYFPINLFQLVKLCNRDGRPHRFGAKQVIEWARHLAEGLHELHHTHQLVHRDITLSNIMFRPAGGVLPPDNPLGLLGAEAVVTDFGTVAHQDTMPLRTVLRSREKDPYKHPDFYPLKGTNQPPKRQQNDPEMDIHALGQVLRVLGRLCTEGGK